MAMSVARSIVYTIDTSRLTFRAAIAGAILVGISLRVSRVPLTPGNVKVSILLSAKYASTASGHYTPLT